MNDAALQRAGAFALIVSGAASAAFWAMAAYAGTFAGAAVVDTPSWTIEQSLHVLGALLAIFGLMAVFAAQREEAGLLGVIGFVLATIGNVLFLAHGIIALVIFPALARHDPTLLELTGAMNQGAVVAFFIAAAAINMLGQVVFGISIWRAQLFPREAAGMLIVGGILFNLPPGPAPMIALAVGGVFWGVAAIWLGLLIVKWRRAAPSA